MTFLIILAGACTGDDDTGAPGADFEASAALEDDIPTVAWVTWTTDTAGSSWVEYGPTRALGSSTVRSDVAVNDHSVLLAGLPTGSTWYWQAVSEVDGEELRSAVTPITTGSGPRDLPRAPSATVFDSTLAAPGFTVTSTLGTVSYVVIYNTEGKPVWWQAADPDSVVAQSRLSDDGTAIVYNLASLNFNTDLGVIRKVRLDGEILSETRTVNGHHDFVELPEGGYAYIAADIRPWKNPDDGETYDVVGDDVIEIPEGATDDTPGDVVWSTWDHIDVSVDPTVDNDFYPQGLDWTHCNSLQLEGDDYIVSVRKEDAFVKVNRTSREQIWQIGGAQSDFELTSGRAFVGQHSPELVEGGFILFDNGDIEADNAYSQAVQYDLDETAMTYTQSWNYDYDQRISSYLLGDVEILDNGNWLVAWGSGGTFTEVTPDGEMALQVSLPAGSALGFTHHLSALGGVAP